MLNVNENVTWPLIQNETFLLVDDFEEDASFMSNATRQRGEYTLIMHIINRELIE